MMNNSPRVSNSQAIDSWLSTSSYNPREERKSARIAAAPESMSSRHSAGASPRVPAFAFFARRFAGARFSPLLAPAMRGS